MPRLLAPVRQSLADDKPIVWNRVTDLPDYVYFNHSIHIAKGVGCSSCHGPVDAHAADLQGEDAHHAVLPGLPSQSRAPVAAERSRSTIPNGTARADTPSPEALMAAISRPRPQPDGLLDMPPVNGPRSKLWRSLEQAADDPAFLARAAQEFPGLAAALAEPRDRRQMLRLMAAAFAMGGLGGCDPGRPYGHLIPAVRIPPNIIPAIPNFYATAHVLDGYASGIVVKHNMGRPIKVEGNPNHPASLGATERVRTGRGAGLLRSRPCRADQRARRTVRPSEPGDGVDRATGGTRPRTAAPGCGF